jgi:hypothetical protein
MNDSFVWVFSGAKGRFPGGIFSSPQNAEEWIRVNCLTGLLTKYPLDQGSFDWAQQQGFVSPKLLDRADSEFVASFSSASFEHYHYEDGDRV